jgi:hypothetical protein
MAGPFGFAAGGGVPTPVAGGVVVEPGPVPGMQGGWTTPSAPAIAGWEATGDPDGDVVDGAGAVGGCGGIALGAFGVVPGVALPGVEAAVEDWPVDGGAPCVGVGARPPTGAVVEGAVVVSGAHGTTVGSLGGGITPGMFAGRPVGVG